VKRLLKSGGIKVDLVKFGDILELPQNQRVYHKALGEIILGYRSAHWVVVQTLTEGGGTGHGPHDTYSAGHKVVCRSSMKISDESGEISFYQTGSFTCMLKEPKVVGEAKLELKIKED